MKGKIKLGQRVTEKISGYTGIVIAVTTWAYGCIRYGVQAEGMHEGKPHEPQWFDEGELTKAAKSKGGPPRNGIETG
jgi:hypothetical protein